MDRKVGGERVNNQVADVDTAGTGNTATPQDTTPPDAGEPSGPEDTPELLREAWRRNRPAATAAAVLTSFHQLAEVAVPMVIGLTIDRALATGDGGSMLRWSGALVVLFACLSFAGCMGLYMGERAVTGATHQMRLRIARRALDRRGIDTDARPGELVSMSSVDAERLAEGLGALVFSIAALAGILAATVYLLATSLSLGLVIVLGLPVVLLLIQTLAQPLTTRAGQQQETVARAAAVATDLFSGLRILKGLGAETAASRRYRVTSRTALHAALDANRARGIYHGIVLGVSSGFLALVAWIGGRQALDGTITVGQLVAAVGVTMFLSGPLGRLAFFAGVLARSRAGAARIGTLLTSPPSGPGGERRLPSPDGAGRRLTLTDVHTGNLTGLDLDVPAGTFAAVVAPDPADAAALIACLDGTSPPDRGRVEVDGVPLHHLDLDEARRAVLITHHDARLFAGTVRSTVTEAAPGTDPGAALDAAGADELVASLPDGLDTPVSDTGSSLSGGQRQRMVLARALAADPPVLVLHDPTTAVDAATEHRVARGLHALRDGRTTLVVTSSPALLAVAHQVVLVTGGRIAARGDHVDLSHTSPAYREAVLA